MTLELPQAVADYFAASNANDVDRLAGCFAPDARVHGEQQGFDRLSRGGCT